MPPPQLTIIKQPYILCCVFPPAGFIGWLIEFTMCLEQHETRHDNPCTHRAYRFLPETCHTYFGPPSHPQDRHARKKKRKGKKRDVTCQAYFILVRVCCSMSQDNSVWKERENNVKFVIQLESGALVHISIPPSWIFAWTVSAGTHELSAAINNGSIGVWIMVYFLHKGPLAVKKSERRSPHSFPSFHSCNSLCEMIRFNQLF